MDDQDQRDGSPPDLPHEGEDDAEPLEREEASPDGIFVDQPELVFSEEEDPESGSPDHEPSPGSSRETPFLIDDDEHAEEAPSERMEESRTPEEEAASDNESDDDSLPEKPQDKDIRNGVSACGQIHCQDQVDQYEHRIQQRDVFIQTLMDIILKKNARLRSLKATIKTLKDQNKALRDTLSSRGRRIPEPLRSDSPESSIDSSSPRGINRWQWLLRDCIAGNGIYSVAWKSSQQNLNMSVDYNMCHPQVRFIAKDPDERGSSRQSSPSEVASVHQNEEIRAIVPLPDSIIFQILKGLLTFDGLIHCFSRLDPFLAPSQFPSQYELGRSSTGLKGRFFISKEARSWISLTHDTIDPQVLLAVLSVCRKFCWYGCHIFYGSNTFAFSSLGELDRFAGGINPARWVRIQNLEISWIGARCVRFNNDSKERLNRRTAALAFLCESASLKTLCIHIRESDRGVIRRPYEPESQKIYMTGKTSGQPNKRMLRSMRSTLGIDYVYQLRGMHWIHVYDLSKEIVNPDRNRAQIRDRSFVLDLERVTTQEKVQARKFKSLLENLDPLFPLDEQRWMPGEEAFVRVRGIFSEETGYDNLVNDLDHDADTSQGTLSSDSDGGDSETDSDEGDESSSSRGPSPSPPGASSRRRSFTPAPRAASDDEEEEHSDSGSNSDDSSSMALRRRSLRRLNQYLRHDSAQSG